MEQCEYGKYCMCATCTYKEKCDECGDCLRGKKQIHDIWTCTKYERKEELRQ